MSAVEELDTYRQHVVVQTLDGNVHVIPRLTLDRFASGHLSLDSIDDGEEILRTITQCWLASLRKSP